MRECPAWFQSELTRIGGANQYGEPIFRLIWSQDTRMVIGGKWAQTGFVGYKEVPAIKGTPCWVLEVWEPASLQGSYEQWQRDFRDEETGLLQCGGYPAHGRYRVLQQFIHRQIVQQDKERHWMEGQNIRTEVTQTKKVETFRMEPCGFMLDVMVPMLMAWRKLSNAAKVAALRQQERLQKEKYLAAAKDAREGTRMGRVMRGSQLVQKRAEIIEKGMRQAMALAAQSGLGMRLSA